MFAAVSYVLSKLISPLWRRVDVSDDDLLLGASAFQGTRHGEGVVTQLCLDYGMIDDVVYFTREEVLGGVPLKDGDLVKFIAIRRDADSGWKAIRVEKSYDAWEANSQQDDSLQLHPLIGKVTSFDRGGGYINQTTFFPLSSLCEGYEPMKGDWVQAKYFVNATQWTTQTQSVTPLRYCRLNQVCVTSVCGNSGVVNDNVFFRLDSLLLPADYKPLPGHLVNLVKMESSQSLYNWRALCMAPCLQGVNLTAHHLSVVELGRILENKGGLDVTDYGQFGDLMIGEKRTLVIMIQNKGHETHRLECCDFAGWDSEEQFSFSSVDPVQSPGVRKKEIEVDILPGERLSIALCCQAKSLGTCAELLLLHFSSFVLGRCLEVTVRCEEENLLLPCVPYCPDNAQQLPQEGSHVITVSAPKIAPRLTNRKLPSFLPHFPVPQALRDCMAGKSDVLVVQPCLGEALSPSNIQSRFSTLLWLEELHAEMELAEFTIHGALLQKGSVYLHLEVLGLAVGRPSLMLGDRILLKKEQGDGVVMEYVSYVTEINDENVSLRVNAEFHRSYLGEPLDVEFSFNRLTMRRCHHALQQTKAFAGFLFPSRVTCQTPQWTRKWIEEPEQNKTIDDLEAPVMENETVSNISVNMKSKATQTKDGQLPSKPIPSPGCFFNPSLNPRQREAVRNIMAGECRPTPYVLFGPPGTGKTITLIEAILQVYHFLPSSRVLVCTPSNSAADLICIRLHESGFLDSAGFVRVNASCRLEEFIPEVLIPYSRGGEDIHRAAFHRIVVSTCSSAGMFYNIGLPVGHFTHFFLDEAGQATEPESLIPIGFVSERDGQIVLAGDPCQLGPIVKSKLAGAFGLGVSLLERLMANPLYCRHEWGYNPKLVTKLTYNYRSHEALLTLPSQLFYNGELIFKAPRAIVESLCQWKALPKKGFPLLFHGTRGKEMRECNNPSWFNPTEAVQVMFYCCQLAKKLYKPVDPSDIGIIAPYKKQCEKIRGLLSKVGLSDVKVGSVEEFQGQEFQAIILSTVRSNESLQNDDLQSALGFLASPKRFNVAVTRAKALLVVVGNPHILIRDPCFRSLVQYSFINGSYLGCDPPPALRDCSSGGVNPCADVTLDST